MESSSDINTTWSVLDFLSKSRLNLSTGRSGIGDSSDIDNIITNIETDVFLPCHNPENIIDESTAKGVESVVHLVILPLLELFGVTTNVINCIVFQRQGLKDRINLCLFSLAVADICCLLLMFAAKFFSFLGLFDADLEEYWSKKYFGTVLGPLFGTITFSTVMKTIISLERCICVLAPFKYKTFLKTKHMLVMIVTLAVCILGIFSLLNMKYVTVHVTDPGTNTSHWVSRLGDFYLQHRLVIDILYNHLLILAAPLLSLVVVVVATFLTVHSLKSKLTWRQETSGRADCLAVKREMAVTKMLMVICLMYVLTMTPSVTQQFFRTLVPGYLPSGKYCNIFVVIQTLVHVCEVADSSLNFIVYFTMGSKFRSTLRQLFSRRKNA